MTRERIFGGFPAVTFICAIFLLAGGQPLGADAMDINSYLLRVDTSSRSLPAVLVLVVALFLANFIWNFVVIALPAVYRFHVTFRSAISGIAALTLLGQLADRAGAYAAMFISPFILGNIFHMSLEPVLAGIIWFSFGLSGLAIGLLAWYFVRVRWQISREGSLFISIAAAILTNPGWAMWIST